MVQVIVQHKVKDFDTWLPLFHAHEPTRRQYGCEGALVHRRIEDPQDVVIVLRWRTAQGFQDFVTNSDLKDVMAKAGVLAPPIVQVLTDPAPPRGASMSVADNTAVVRRYIEDVVIAGDLDLIEELYSPGYRNHTNPPGVPAGPAGVRALIGAFRAAFPDVSAKILHLATDGDLVIWHTETSGTHRGELMGVPPTGRRATWRAISIDRLEDGRIAERWEVFDVAGLMAQLQGPKS